MSNPSGIVQERGPGDPCPHAQLRAVKDTSTVWLWEQDAEFRFIVDLRGRDGGPGEGSVLGIRRWESRDAAPLHGTWDEHRKWVEARKPFRDFEFRVGHGPQACYISTTGVPVYAADGTFAGYRGTAMDVTELKNSQEAADRAQALLKVASHLGRVAAWSIELPEKQIAWSRDFLQLLGFPEDASPGVPQLLALIRRRQQPEVIRAWQACVDEGVPFDLEVRVFTVAGDPIWLRLIGEAALSGGGRTRRIQGAAQDITASKEDRERLRSLGEQLTAANAELAQRVRERTRELELANTELKGFAHALAHDLKAPIEAVQGFSVALHEALARGDQARGSHYAQRIQAAGARMGGYVDALLSLAQTTQAPLSESDVDLGALAATVLDELQAREPSRQLERVIDPGLVVRGDRRLLGMLMENLLGNAWKFSARRPRARISVTGRADAAGRMVYAVQDNGAGFDMAYADRLFESFQRLHTADEYAGTGVGLANALRVVLRHGGRIWAESRLGDGATFLFTLHEE